jgi:bifunctional NMN adenylyltransferase/nudix hydrolase
MLNQVTPDAEIGVIVGRFQAPSLHGGHLDLIETVAASHPKVLILVGCKPSVMCTRNNPLDYHTRMLMIRDAFPDVSIMPLYDRPSDDDWSREVDGKVRDAFGGIGRVVLYGSRDGFIPHYSGKHATVELAPSRNVSATEARKLASNDVRSTEDFRRGVTYAAFNKHPVAYPTVDMILTDGERILVGRKPNDPIGKWRFPGGFVDPSDKSLEAAAKRELREETGVDAGRVEYLGSTQINDWRYANEVDCIMTSVFCMEYLWGPAIAGDDLSEVRWVGLDEIDTLDLMELHEPILELALAHLKKG